MANMFASDAADFDSTATILTDRVVPATGIANFFRVIGARLAIARQKRTDLEVGRFIELNGGQLTDDLERQISRQFGSPSGY